MTERTRKIWDDAVSLRREGEHYILSVHIADVANYVQENSALDWEARERGTSVYLADRCCPCCPGLFPTDLLAERGRGQAWP